MEKKNTTQKFTNARLLAVQAVYAKEFSPDSWDKITSRFLLGEIGGRVIKDGVAGRESEIDLQPADAKLFTKLIKEVREKEEEINELIQNNMGEKLDYERLEILMKCILKVGIAEFYANPNLDSPIIINEYIELTHSFFEGPETKIVNAILDKFSKVIRE